MTWRPYLAEARSSLRAFRMDEREDRDRLDRVLHDRRVEGLIREFDKRGSEVGRLRVVKQLRRHLDPVVAYGGWINRPPHAVWAPLELRRSRLKLGRRTSERYIRLRALEGLQTGW